MLSEVFDSLMSQVVGCSNETQFGRVNTAPNIILAFDTATRLEPTNRLVDEVNQEFLDGVIFIVFNAVEVGVLHNPSEGIAPGEPVYAVLLISYSSIGNFCIYVVVQLLYQ